MAFDATPDSTLDLTTDELLTTTRAVRKRLDLTRTVPLDLVRECLEIAIQAPTGSNSQGWQWIVVTDPEVRATIAGYYQKSFERYRRAGRAAGSPYAGDPARAATQERVGDSSDWLAEHYAEVPVFVIPCIHATSLPEGNQAGLWGSIIPAAWSYMLAARARGLGTCWTTLHLKYEQEVAELLGLPEGMRQAALIPTAYFTGETFKPAKRDPLATILHLDRWGPIMPTADPEGSTKADA